LNAAADMADETPEATTNSAADVDDDDDGVSLVLPDGSSKIITTTRLTQRVQLVSATRTLS